VKKDCKIKNAKCLKCNKFGHYQKNCTTKNLFCDKCGGKDHTRLTCKTCEICLSGNHKEEDCLNKPCSKCGHPKHFTRYCRFIENYCFNCGKLGHKEKNCKSCIHCGMNNH